jgi:hypothetical protein
MTLEPLLELGEDHTRELWQRMVEHERLLCCDSGLYIEETPWLKIIDDYLTGCTLLPFDPIFVLGCLLPMVCKPKRELRKYHIGELWHRGIVLICLLCGDMIIFEKVSTSLQVSEDDCAGFTSPPWNPICLHHDI